MNPNKPFFPFTTNSEKRVALRYNPEQYLSKDKLAHLHSCIHFTHKYLKNESAQRIETPSAKDLEQFK